MYRRDLIRMLALGGAVAGAGRAGRVLAATPGGVATGLADGAAGGSADGVNDGAIVSKIALVDNRVVIGLTINGTGPYLFLIDTGGFLSIIDDALAHSLKLEAKGGVSASGIGGRVVMPLYFAREIVFGGGARQRGVVFATRKGGFGGDIKGALAAGLLTAADSDLDIERGEWRTYPAGRPERTGFVRIANAIETGGVGSSHLFGDATVDGRRMRFVLDTGAPGGLSLYRRAAQDLGLWNDTRPYAPMRPTGIGGQAGVARLVRGDSIEFGGATYDRPLLLLRAEGGRSGDAPGKATDGIIGLGLLRQFNLSTEVKARALWVQRTAEAAPLTDRYGLSGLWIDRDNGVLTIADVGTGSPAAAAGLKAGDRIVGDDFPTLLRKLGSGPGTEIDLKTERKGVGSAVRLRLARYL